MALILFIYSIAYVVTAFQASEQMNKTSPHLGEQTHGSKGAVPRFFLRTLLYRQLWTLFWYVLCLSTILWLQCSPLPPHSAPSSNTTAIESYWEGAANSCSQMKNNSKRKKTKVPQSALHCSTKPKSQSICHFYFHSFRKYSTANQRSERFCMYALRVTGKHMYKLEATLRLTVDINP